MDAGLAGAILRVDADSVLRDGDLLGRLLESFVVFQLRAELSLASPSPRLFHVRQRDGSIEVDIIVELSVGQLIGMEVKASGAPTRRDARHLLTMRDSLADRFVAGVVFHTGPRTFELDDRGFAIPIAALWGPGEPTR